MKTYDEFLTWAAEQHYNDWLGDWEGDQVAWGQLKPNVIATAAAIYEQEPFDVNEAFKQRLRKLYGNPLTVENGERSEW